METLRRIATLAARSLGSMYEAPFFVGLAVGHLHASGLAAASRGCDESCVSRVMGRADATLAALALLYVAVCLARGRLGMLDLLAEGRIDGDSDDDDDVAAIAGDYADDEYDLGDYADDDTGSGDAASRAPRAAPPPQQSSDPNPFAADVAAVSDREASRPS